MASDVAFEAFPKIPRLKRGCVIVRETRVDPWSNSEDTTDLEHGACIAIALALML